LRRYKGWKPIGWEKTGESMENGKRKSCYDQVCRKMYRCSKIYIDGKPVRGSSIHSPLNKINTINHNGQLY